MCAERRSTGIWAYVKHTMIDHRQSRHLPHKAGLSGLFLVATADV
ncbi:MAG: CRISPR-associated protein Cas5 [Bacteroidales bacterium]|nr:CRISPR-associated protein Cas5 [Bacteroidales bacterium]